MSDLNADADVLDAAAADLVVSDPTLSAQLTADAVFLREAAAELEQQQEFVDTLARFLPEDESPDYSHEVSLETTFAPTIDETFAAASGVQTRVLICVASVMGAFQSPGIMLFPKTLTVGEPQWAGDYSYATNVCPMGVEVEAVGP